MIERVNPSSLARASGYSHAVVVPEGVRTIYLAGQAALDASGVIVGAGDIVVQFEQALSNLLTALAAAGGSASDLVQITIYIVDVPSYRARAAEIGAVWRQLCGREYPAAAGIGVARLWDDDALVELSAVAAVPSLPSPPQALRSA